MTRTIGVEQSYSFGELASHNTAVWKAAVGPGSCLAQVPVRYSGMRRAWVGSRQDSSTPKTRQLDRFAVSQMWTEVPEVIGRGKTQDHGDDGEQQKRDRERKGRVPADAQVGEDRADEEQHQPDGSGHADERHGNAGDQADGAGELQRAEPRQP